MGTASAPPPTLVSASDLNDPAIAELYEGVLITVEGLTVADDDAGYGEWIAEETSSTKQLGG